jgi:SPP1 gp7 family putative phage head morphogenesis protein
MPSSLPTLGFTTPRDAVEAYQRRGLLQPSYSWADVWGEEHAAAFAIAGVLQTDVLQRVHDVMTRAIATGRNLADVAPEIRSALVSAGLWGDVEITDPVTGETRVARFDDRRLKLIYDANMRTAHAAGQYQQQLRNRSRRPLLMYLTMGDEHVRPLHASWHGVTLPIDHPWWQTHYAPNGWRCRCRVVAVSEAEAEEYRQIGVPVRREAPDIVRIPHINHRTGEVRQIPAGIDPGWEHHPGTARPQRLAELQRQALDGTSPDVAQALARQRVAGEDGRRFVRAPQADEQVPLAMLPADTAQALARGADDAAGAGATVPGAAPVASRTVMLPGEVVQARSSVRTDAPAWSQAEVLRLHAAIASPVTGQPVATAVAADAAAATGLGYATLSADGAELLVAVLQATPEGPQVARLERLPVAYAATAPTWRTLALTVLGGS